LSAPQAISVDFDATFVVVLVLVIALTLLLKNLLFDPMLALFEEREKLIDGAKAQARRTDEKSAGALAAYEAEMAKARASGNAARDASRAQALKSEREILESVREHTSKLLEEGKRAVQAEASRARSALSAEVPALARDLAGRVLGREVQR
jgi:F-type H+-transporting ATPase subunit b